MILQYRGTSFISIVIRAFSKLRFWTQTANRYSHTSWSFCTLSKSGTLEGDLSEWESWQPKGVRHEERIGGGHTKGTRVDLYELVLPIDKDKVADGKKFLEDQKGKEYDFWGIWGVLIRRNDHTPGKWFCSELIDAFLKMCGVALFNFIESYQVVPGLIPSSPIVRYIGYIITGECESIGYVVHDLQEKFL